ncbi:hypothetical protein Tco_0585389 [Tanacetum coccineum]
MHVHYILPGLSAKTRVLWKLSCLLEAARQSLACIRLCLMCQSCLLGAGRTSYSLPPEETGYSLPVEGASYSLPLKETSYSLVIASGPEVAFVTPAIPVDHSNMEWFCLKNIMS